jgi:hypothetical protein
VGGSSKLHPCRDGWYILRLLIAEAHPRTPTSFRSTADWHLARQPTPSPDEPIVLESAV